MDLPLNDLDVDTKAYIIDIWALLYKRDILWQKRIHNIEKLNSGNIVFWYYWRPNNLYATYKYDSNLYKYKFEKVDSPINY